MDAEELQQTRYQISPSFQDLPGHAHAAPPVAAATAAGPPVANKAPHGLNHETAL